MVGFPFKLSSFIVCNNASPNIQKSICSYGSLLFIKYDLALRVHCYYILSYSQLLVSRNVIVRSPKKKLIRFNYVGTILIEWMQLYQLFFPSLYLSASIWNLQFVMCNEIFVDDVDFFVRFVKCNWSPQKKPCSCCCCRWKRNGFHFISLSPHNTFYRWTFFPMRNTHAGIDRIFILATYVVAHLATSLHSWIACLPSLSHCPMPLCIIHMFKCKLWNPA